ncbi:MAG: hypothetical protein KGL00_01770 [Gammaproteobacteria bacterium]|nr:hypothetical protein [Gammaproteobacteria bacterium]MDE2272900.1 hypothetical protein [Gammaproteobacteria bacterium]
MGADHNTPAFFTRLKQHRLYQVTLGYAIVAGFFIQIGGRALPYFGWGAAVPAVIIVLLAGFPVALALAWMLIEPQDPALYTDWQKLHWKLGATITATVSVLVILSGLYAWKLSVRHAQRLAAIQAEATAAPASFNPPANSLVVLPFRNLNADPAQQYFSDGITEELTGALGHNPVLRVIAWKTASTLHNSNLTAADIGKQLNVAYILYGSILHQGEQVRIAVELVNTVTNYQLWSAHYDASFKNIFTVQDQATAAIAQALKVQLVAVDSPANGTSNPEAHELVLKGRTLFNKQDVASLAQAQIYFERAAALDPAYAEAHALLSRTLFVLTQRSDLALQSTLSRIRAEANRARTLDPRNADAWVALGNAEASSNPPDFAEARAAYRQALAIEPSNAGAHNAYGNLLPLKQALAQAREATALDPVNKDAWNNLAVDAQDLGDWPQVVEAAGVLIRLDPQNVDGAFLLANAYQQLQQYDAMIGAFERVKPATSLDKRQVKAGRLTYQAVHDPKFRRQALAAVKALARHASNPAAASNLVQLYLALGETAPALGALENLCPASPVACGDLAVNPIYRALHGQPRFQQLAEKYSVADPE